MILVPSLYGTSLIALGMVGPGAIVLGGFVPLIAWLLAPDLEAVGGQRRWRVAFVALGIGLVALAAGRAIGSRATVPSRSMLVYAQNADAADGWLVTAAAFAGPGTWNEAALNAPARPVERNGPAVPGAPPRWLALVAGGRSPVVAARAPRVAIVPPAVTIIADQTSGAERHLTLRINAAPSTNSIGLHVTGAAVIAARIDGREVDTRRYRVQTPDWQLTYWGPSDGGFTLSLVVAKEDRPTLELLAHTSGLPTLPGVVIPPRPTGVLPSQAGDMTVVYRRIDL